MTIKMEEHLATRLNDLALVRATEQTSMALALCRGKREVRKSRQGRPAQDETSAPPNGQADESGGQVLSTEPISNPTESIAQEKSGQVAPRSALARVVGVRCFESVLKRAYCRGRLALRHPLDHWSQDAYGMFPDVSHAEMLLDLVPSPADGARSLLDGRDAASISVLGGGPPGAFKVPLVANNEPPEYFLVWALSPNLSLKRERDETLDAVMGPPRSGCSVGDLVSSWLETIRCRLQSRKPSYELTVGLLDGEEQPKELRKEMRSSCRIQLSSGSSVAAAITVFLGRAGIDAFFGVVRCVHTMLMAIAASATECKMYAVPCIPDKKGKVQVSGEAYTASSLLDPETDVFLIATGITENLALQGVRFHGAKRATTQTLVLRPRTGSVRFVKTNHDLSRKPFYLGDKEGSWSEFVEQLYPQWATDRSRNEASPEQHRVANEASAH